MLSAYEELGRVITETKCHLWGEGEEGGGGGGGRREF